MYPRPPKGAGQQQGTGAIPPHTAVARRVWSSSHYARQYGTDGEVHIAVDDAPAGPFVSQPVAPSSRFIGGSNSVTPVHQVIDIRTSHPPGVEEIHPCCQMPGCVTTVMSEDILPCECDYKICRDCYINVADGICPGCKERYKQTDLDNTGRHLLSEESIIQNSPIMSMKPTKSEDVCYGFGSLSCSEDEGTSGPTGAVPRLKQPLTHKLKIPAAVLSPYRLVAFIRLVLLGLFLQWRISHPNEDAIWLWLMSVVCEVWFGFSWLLDQLPKLAPLHRKTNLNALKQKFETHPSGKSDLPGVDVFVSTADPEKEPPLVTANTILSILAVDYPVEKLSCYVSDDGGSVLTFEAMAEAAMFAKTWVPFCRKHQIEPRNPETYFSLKTDPFKKKVKHEFVNDRRRVKRKYEEFKVRINGLPDAIRKRSDAYNVTEEIKAEKKTSGAGDEVPEPVKIPKATWMSNATHWPGTWMIPSAQHSKGDHASIIQAILEPPSDEPLNGTDDEKNPINLSEVDIRLPMLVYVSREKRPGYDHNKKAGAMNALVRSSAIMSNGPFILNLDCDHYIYNSQAIREGMCFMMDQGGDRICYVQFPQRFEGIDPSDRYANRNTVFFDVNMRALDGLQGPVYVGTGTLFRRTALYGFDPPRSKEYHPGWFVLAKKSTASATDENPSLRIGDSDNDGEMTLSLFRKRFGISPLLVKSIQEAEYQGRPLADDPMVKNGRKPGVLTKPRQPLQAPTITEAISVISCWYEGKTQWGNRVGWIYGSVTEDVVTGYRMHNRGWRSIYCVTKPDAFRGTAPINLTDRLHQVLRWATGSVEIFFSRNNALFAGSKMKLLQRIAYLNVAIYPFTSFFLIIYCFLPALSLFSGHFIVQTLDTAFLVYLLLITLTLCLLAALEIKWSGIELEEWWRNEQFWLLGGTSAHLVAVLQGLLKVVAGIEISFTLTTKSGGDEDDDKFADLYIVKWSSLMIPPIVIIMTNLFAIMVGASRTIYSVIPQWNRLIGGVFFSFWVLAHLYPFAKGLMGRRGKMSTIVLVWSGLITITVSSLLWVAIKPLDASTLIGDSFQFP